MNFQKRPKEKRLYKKITIYGAYAPKSENIRLMNLRDHLKRNGFNGTKLVKDYDRSYFPFNFIEDQDHYFYKRSIYCVENSDLNIFIYTFKGKAEGTSLELSHSVFKENRNFLVFAEEKRGHQLCSRLVSGFLVDIGRRLILFPKDDNKFLMNVVYQRTFDHFLE